MARWLSLPADVPTWSRAGRAYPADPASGHPQVRRSPFQLIGTPPWHGVPTPGHSLFSAGPWRGDDWCIPVVRSPTLAPCPVRARSFAMRARSRSRARHRYPHPLPAALSLKLGDRAAVARPPRPSGTIARWPSPSTRRRPLRRAQARHWSRGRALARPIWRRRALAMPIRGRSCRRPIRPSPRPVVECLRIVVASEPPSSRAGRR